MVIRALNNQQHREILKCLLKLSQRVEDIKQIHAAGAEYHSLMICFLFHIVSAAKSLEHLYEAFGEEWFPTTVGYTIVRPIFEIDVTSHYISNDRASRANRYIKFENVLKKRQMDAWVKHRNSDKPDWREAMETAWQNVWEPKTKEIESKYQSVSSIFNSKGKKESTTHNWSGKSIRDMAIEVNHGEAYDVFYADLSSFTHADVRLVNRFLRTNAEGIRWTARAFPEDVGGVFRYADIFFHCFLCLFGQEFNVWTKKNVDDCLYAKITP